MQEFNTEFFYNKDFVIKKEKLKRDVQLQLIKTSLEYPALHSMSVDISVLFQKLAG